MVRRFLVTISMMAVVGSGLAHAADDHSSQGDDQTCNQQTTVDIEQCLGRLTKAWDQRLNSAYQKLLKDNPEADKLRAAQRLWVQFRDANCRYYGAGEGTIKRLDAAECMRSTTAHRALELEQTVKGDGG